MMSVKKSKFGKVFIMSLIGLVMMTGCQGKQTHSTASKKSSTEEVMVSNVQLKEAFLKQMDDYGHLMDKYADSISQQKNLMAQPAAKIDRDTAALDRRIRNNSLNHTTTSHLLQFTGDLRQFAQLLSQNKASAKKVAQRLNQEISQLETELKVSADELPASVNRSTQKLDQIQQTQAKK
ncbi:hypothetical protein HU830_07190 [Lactobacillus sp. DCY120]|uniref:Lipoprotein n=1 Tax=Bombilactobacillus apium TaxID=2675299 RepID=A0A850R1Y2_9LACO|nr:hypothetical protein [Bombilactobacillus apium]NVY96933.1 hypothetical protein [Bombilactobacillus apium]